MTDVMDGQDDEAAPDAPGADAGHDGLPGLPIAGHPGWRAGAFGHGGGALGLYRVDAGSGGRPGRNLLIQVADRRQGDTEPMPPAYRPDGHGGVQLRPGFAQTHPKGPFDFGAMAHNIDWGGVGEDLANIAGGVVTSFVGDELGIPSWLDLLDTGKETVDAQNEANKPGEQRPKQADRATNGAP